MFVEEGFDGDGLGFSPPVCLAGVCTTDGAPVAVFFGERPYVFEDEASCTLLLPRARVDFEGDPKIPSQDFDGDAILLLLPRWTLCQ